MLEKLFSGETNPAETETPLHEEGNLEEQTDADREEIIKNVQEQIDPVEKPTEAVVPDGPDPDGHTYEGNPHRFNEKRAA